MKLWHVSGDGPIARFEPRPPAKPLWAGMAPVVWAVDDDHLGNYLLPRDCPRVCVRAQPESSQADVDRHLSGARHSRLVMISSEWLRQLQCATLWLHSLPADGFVCADRNAGYYVSTSAVVPSAVTLVTSAQNMLRERGFELRIVDDLQTCASEIAASSLSFSIIRLPKTAS